MPRKPKPIPPPPPPPEPIPTPTGLVFGTLNTDSNRASQEFAAGLKTAGHEVYWDRVEGSDGVWNTTQLSLIKTQLDKFKLAGMSVTLDTGIHYPPSYVYTLGRYTNLKSGGENPGYGDTTNYGPTMANVLCHQAKVGGWTCAYWAHDHNLYDGMGGITLADYSRSISTA